MRSSVGDSDAFEKNLDHCISLPSGLSRRCAKTPEVHQVFTAVRVGAARPDGEDQILSEPRSVSTERDPSSGEGLPDRNAFSPQYDLQATKGILLHSNRAKAGIQ